MGGGGIIYIIIYIVSPPSSATPEMSRIGECRVSALTPDMAVFCTLGKKQEDTDSDKDRVSERLAIVC